MPELPQSYQSVGYLAGQLQLSVAVIQAAMQVLDIQPAYYQNGIGYFGDEGRTELIRRFIERDMLHHVMRGTPHAE